MHEAGHSKLVLWDNSEGWDGEGSWRGAQDGGTHVHLWLIHVDVWNKPPQFCNYPSTKINKLILKICDLQIFSPTPWVDFSFC